MTKIIHDHSAVKSAPLGAAGVAEQGHSGNDILLGVQKKKNKAVQLALSFSSSKNKLCAEPSEMEPAGLEVVGVICWFISVPGGFKLD